MKQWIDIVEGATHNLVSFAEYGEHASLLEGHVVSFMTFLENLNWTCELGRTRAAFVSPDHKKVIKVPLCDEGILGNNMEARAFQRHNSAPDTYIPIAACRIFYADADIGVPMLMMRYVKPVSASEYKDLPAWASMVDGFQVGRDHKNNLVAYDL